jgi:hypothetical protein
LGTSAKVVPVLGNASAGGRTCCSWALGKFELLCLKGQKIVDPFDEEKALKKRKLQGATVIEFPIHKIEDGVVKQVMMRLEVKSILGEVAEHAARCWNMVGERDVANCKRACANYCER